MLVLKDSKNPIKIFVIVISLTVSLYALTGANAIATPNNWTESVGEATTDDARTLSEVKQEALAKARANAIEKALGIKVQGETVVRDFALQSDFVATISSGVITEEKIVKWATETVKKEDNSAPVLIYRVFLLAKVQRDSGTSDPSFKIHASINRSVLKNGDDVIVRVKSTKDCYITLFVITEKNNVYLVLPNKFKKANFIKPGEEFIYPSERDIARGLTLKAGLLPESVKTKEMFRIIATTRPISFTPNIFKEGIGLESFQQETATLSELVKELMAIPAAERTEALLTYEIVK